MSNSPSPFISRHTELRPPSPKLIDTLYQLAVTDQISWQWLSGPETPETFAASVWGGVLAQYGIASRRTGEQVGLIRAYSANTFHQYAYISLYLLPQHQLKVWPLEAGLLFANHLFRKFNLRNIYAETAESEFSQFGSAAASFFEVEGRLKGRLLVDGKPEDLYLLKVSRETWEQRGVPLLAHCLPRPRGHAVTRGSGA